MSNLPTAPEVCQECEQGKHVLHVVGQLGDLIGRWELVDIADTGETKYAVTLHGQAEDELWLEEILNLVKVYMSRR